MSTTWVVIIIVLVLGVVIGNITLLKYSAKFKFPTPSKPFDDVEDSHSDNPPSSADTLSDTQPGDNFTANSPTSERNNGTSTISDDALNSLNSHSDKAKK